jgi:hypothetical protein
MKNKLPLILTVLGGAYLVFWLRRKAQAGANLQFIPLDIAIDSRRSGLFRIYYSVKLRLINNETANVNIKGINLKAFIDNKFVGDIISNASFNVPAKGTTDIKLDTSISTGSIARLIFDAITDGINFSMNINGFVDTDLGRVNVNFTKQVGQQGINGIDNSNLIGQYIQSDFRKEIGIIKAIDGDFVTIEYPSLGFTEAVNYKLVPLTIVSHKKFDVK